MRAASATTPDTGLPLAKAEPVHGCVYGGHLSHLLLDWPLWFLSAGPSGTAPSSHQQDDREGFHGAGKIFQEDGKSDA